MFNDIKSYYGSIDFQFSKSATEICSDLGYSSCIAGQLKGITFFYKSKDQSCKTIQLIDSETTLMPCTEKGMANGYCNKFGYINSEEPVSGDTEYRRHLMDVLCCK